MAYSKQDRQILALQRAAKNPKYRQKVLIKIKEIKEKKRMNDWLSQ